MNDIDSTVTDSPIEVATDLDTGAATAPTPIPSFSSAARSAVSVPYSSRLMAVPLDPDGVHVIIERLIAESGLTQSEIARRMGISKQSVSQYVQLRRKRPSIIWLARLALVCGSRILVEAPAKGTVR